MPLLTLDALTLEFGDQPILHAASLTIEEGERVCLIGRNGAGKSTLLGLITGRLQPDAGEIRRRQGLRVAELPQALPEDADSSVRDYVGRGMQALRELLDEYAARSAAASSAADLAALEGLERRIDAEGGWQYEQRLDSILSELSLPGGARLGELSGGWQRRVALARALVARPDLLLLDEPTNHLDLASIHWLEERLRAWRGAVLFITHDRAFLRRLATRIVELDRARLTSWPGGWGDYLRRKEAALAAEATEQALFEKRLAEEEVWIRQGIEARRTRNEGRVRALLAMRREYAERQRLRPQQRSRLHIEETAEESGRRVIELENISHGYGGQALIRDFSLTVMRGDRIALVGNNGVGKSTLLKIMLGRLEPQAGTVRLGTQLEIAWFDQLRSGFDERLSVAEIVGEGRDHVLVDGKPRHVIGYLGGFLFSPARARTPLGALSGGERNRVLLARLFTRPSNLLVLDEPTNDLDVETLEVLEERLMEYSGTLLVVSHDREFIDNVATSTLVFEADGAIRNYPGGYADWAARGHALADRESLQAAAGTPADALAPAGDRPSQADSKTSVAPPASRQRLSYKLQRELDALPREIERQEQTLASLDERIGAADFYAQPYPEVQSVLERRAAVAAELERLLERWVELSDA